MLEECVPEGHKGGDGEREGKERNTDSNVSNDGQRHRYLLTSLVEGGREGRREGGKEGRREGGKEGGKGGFKNRERQSGDEVKGQQVSPPALD